MTPADNARVIAQLNSIAPPEEPLIEEYETLYTPCGCVTHTSCCKNEEPAKLSLTFQDALDEVLNEIREFLLAKNRKYGNSMVVPVRIFSKADPIEQIKVRLDDKLSRLISSQQDEDEDVAWDLLGYLIGWKVAERFKK